jgi:L-ascorbate metabolism protein UlaG (beta-lactamase superfamily)
MREEGFKMRRFHAVIAVVLFSALVCVAADPTSTQVTYVANEGFLLQVGGKKILIDAIFNDGTINFAHVPDTETLERLEKAEPPFDDVDLILVTHKHRDHFEAEPVLHHLASNPEGVLLAPSQAVELLQASDADLDRFGDRIRDLKLDLYESTELTVRGIRIEAHRLRHSAYMIKDEKTGESYNRHEGIENLVYVIEIGGVKFFHVGDAILSQDAEYFTDEQFPRQKVNVAFLEYFDWSEETKEILQDRMSPDHVVFMHLPPQKEQIEKIARRVAELYPSAFVFREPMETRSLDELGAGDTSGGAEEDQSEHH